MPVTIVTGAPFSGKGQLAKDEIARRESSGELGLFLLDFTLLYTALVPGIQSSWRDGALSDTGAARMVGATYEVVISAIVARELSGYITTQSPRRALAIAERIPGASIVDIPVAVEDIASRATSHLATMRRRVPRSRTGVGGLARCREAGSTYLRERPMLVGKAREAKRTPDGWTVGRTRVREFDRALWQRGLTPKGHEALAEMVSLGNPEPSPTDVLQFLLKNPVEG